MRTHGLAEGLFARGRRAAALAAGLDARAVRLSAFLPDAHAFARFGYCLYARDFVTGMETELGFIPVEGPLVLSDVELPDGNYVVEVRADGYYWRDCRFESTFPVSVEDGELVAPLPAVVGLQYAVETGGTRLSWSWTDRGTQAPDDFAVWLGPTEPVDTSGVPDLAVSAVGPGMYSVSLGVLTAAVYVVACARRGSKTGPAATLSIPAPLAVLASPDNQSARHEQE